MIGPVHCGCSIDASKSKLIERWKYGEELKLKSRDYVGNSIEHTKQMSTKQLSILWRTGDWPIGVFLMQTLPQSSYLQGQGECLHCAVENAALAGCPEVIACGGGQVSEEARNTKPATALAVMPVTPAIGTTATSTWSPMTPQSSIGTPPPPYSSPSPSKMQPIDSYFAISDARGDKIVAVPNSTVQNPSTIKRKALGSRCTVEKRAIAEIVDPGSLSLSQPYDLGNCMLKGNTIQSSKVEDGTATKVALPIIKRKPVGGGTI